MTEITRNQLKNICQTPQWDGVIAFMAEMIDKWQGVPVKQDTEFDTIWAMATKEAKVEGIKQFFDTLEREALND